jgi:hypothetical protein
VSSMGTLFVGGQSFIGSADLDRPAKVGMTGRLEVHLTGTHTVQITGRDGPRVRFKILT